MRPIPVTTSLFVALSLLLSACVVSSGCSIHAGPTHHGSGITATETRDTGPFSRIEIAGSTDVEAVVGDSATTVTVTADDNLVGSVTTEVRSGTLRVSLKNGSYSFDVSPIVRVTVPELTSVTVSGSADARVRGLDGESFHSVIQGSGNVRAEGRVDVLEATIRGSGDLELDGLEAREAHVEIAGSGDASVRATGKLTAEVKGSGDVVYRGDPEQVSKSVHGSGSIRKR
jgi:hypothetical protein